MSTFITGTARRIALTGLGASAALALVAGTATATTVRGGIYPVAPGSSVGAPLVGTATFTGSATITCTTGSLDGTVGTNPIPNVPFTVTSFSLSACTDTVPAFNVISVSRFASGTGSIAYASTTPPQGTLRAPGLVLRFRITAAGLPGTCDFGINNAAVTAPGTIDNTTNRAVFTAVPVSSTNPICASAGPLSLSAAFGPLTVLSVPLLPPPGSAVVGSLVTVTP